MTKDELISRIRPAPGCVLVQVVRIPPTSDIVSGDVIAVAQDTPPYLRHRRVQFSERSSPSFTINGEIFHVVHVNNILDVESPRPIDDKG
jgi:hypothetical protein